MTIRTIIYDKQLAGEGRNGGFKQSGLELWRTKDHKGNDIIYLQGLTSKGEPARGYFSIPVEAISQLRSVLEMLGWEKDDDGTST